ncbi:hypothetical protein BSIN_4234 [Burkholderia singularis]|uniref:Uncharacterized protein n=1 Tax=Burkholderia singularis TaxID=1503053 RepID=A0A238H7M9_9BURK|nr:hypothetical protein BSIN_4234 [Burkholderia singularis]
MWTNATAGAWRGNRTALHCSAPHDYCARRAFLHRPDCVRDNGG